MLEALARGRALVVPLACGAGLALPTSAWCDQPLWELGGGLAALQLPHYRGSDQSRAMVLPLPYVIYRGDFLKADRDGARAQLIESGNMDLDLSVAASAPTNSRDNRARAGMDDLAPTFEVGPRLQVKLAKGPGWKVDLRVPVRAVFTIESRPQMVGWTAAPNINLDLKLGEWNFGVLTGPVWGSQKFNAYTYSVGAADATASRPAYQAKAGSAGWQTTMGASRRLGNAWLGVFAKADTLTGATFVDSPLVRQRGAYSVGIGMSWVFATSSQRVGNDR
jgi:outer membrane scaffolding protein for murein synthesis (MipA/OmpV family)